MRLAIIDLGTNSIRFDVHEFSKTPSAKHGRRLHREKLMVRLGQDVFLTGKLNPEAENRTLQAFLRFKKIMRSLHVTKVIACATSAIREAEDQKKFLSTLQKRTGICIQVISGEEEARLIALGILSNEKIPRGKCALIDIGGGSTEISLCQGKKILQSRSFPLGSARLDQIFLKRNPPSKSAIRSLRSFIQQKLEQAWPPGKSPKIKRIVGSSGTIQTLVRILNRGKTGKAAEFKDLKKLNATLSLMSNKQILQIPFMEPKRVDLLLPGSLLLEEFMNHFSAKRLYSTEYALRDGLLAEEKQLYRQHDPSHLAFHLPEIRKKAMLWGMSSDQAKKTILLSTLIFNKLKPLHHLKQNWLAYLIVSSLLKDSGQSVAFTNHAEHSYYIAKHLDLPSLQPWESELIAQLCRLHEDQNITAHELPFTRHPKRQKATAKLLAMLKIIDALDCGLASTHPLKQIRMSRKTVRFYLSHDPGADLEILRLERKKKFFEQTFNRKICVQKS